jgi:hypothetical protein
MEEAERTIEVPLGQEIHAVIDSKRGSARAAPGIVYFGFGFAIAARFIVFIAVWITGALAPFGFEPPEHQVNRIGSIFAVVVGCALLAQAFVPIWRANRRLATAYRLDLAETHYLRSSGDLRVRGRNGRHGHRRHRWPPA